MIKTTKEMITRQHPDVEPEEYADIGEDVFQRADEFLETLKLSELFVVFTGYREHGITFKTLKPIAGIHLSVTIRPEKTTVTIIGNGICRQIEIPKP